MVDMKAALLLQPGKPFQIEDVELEGPRAGEVQVRLHACGVCHSDWHVRTGDTQHVMPVIAGHEGAGRVEAVGEGVERVQVGDAVVLSWAPQCGRCFYCLHDKAQLCDTYIDSIWKGVMLDGTSRLRWGQQTVYVYCGLGGFAEQAIVAEQSCVPVGEGIPLSVASLIGCAVSTGVGAALRTADTKSGESVAVFGCGGVGLSVIQGAALVGAHPIIAVDPLPRRRDYAQEFGATHTLGLDRDPVQAVRDLTAGRGVDVAFEAVGRTDAQQQTVEATRPGGRAVLVGLTPMGRTIDLDTAALTREEKTVQGSYYGSMNTARDFPLLLDLYRAGRLKLDALVSREYPLEDINAAYDAMLQGDVARSIILFE
jgi:NDMA-dependent alcohol dehydrogenase